ncbi:MAG: DoxX family protein [Bryobacteraceae bacterium]|jgi:uncharacterized membrane protein YphA (DoxX/SURF4 family)
MQGKGLNIVLWITQWLLATLFLFAGGFKLVLPAIEMQKQSTLPVSFLRFIGVAEVFGGLGLILPGLLRIRVGLTPLAAVALVIIMIGATVTTIGSRNIGQAPLPIVTGVLLVWIAYARLWLAPLRGRA